MNTMRNTVLAALLAGSLVAPAAAHAQAVSRITPSAAPDLGVTIAPGQWLAIGAGAIAGAVLLDIVLPVRIAYILGGAAGGYLANMWYSGHQPEIRLTPAPKT
jgi:hypothetical protein